MLSCCIESMGRCAQLASLDLHDGQNTIDFTFARQRLRAYIYFLHWHTRCAGRHAWQPLRCRGHSAVSLFCAASL
jgi:hypothetical protein